MLQLEKQHKFIKQIHTAYITSQISCTTASTCYSHPNPSTSPVPQSTLKTPEIRQQSRFKQTLKEKAPVTYDGRLEVMHGGIKERVLCVGGGLINPLALYPLAYKSSAGLSPQSWSMVERKAGVETTADVMI